MKEHPAFTNPVSPFPCTECAAGVMHLTAYYLFHLAWRGADYRPELPRLGVRYVREAGV